MARRLPPLNALRAFEVAGRHLNFSLAAEELHVTQGAISRQVRLLEEFFGEALFLRVPRGVALTEFGKRCLDLTTDCFDRLAEGLTSQKVGKRDLSVSILPSSATLWLQQRLSSFELEHPDIRLTVSTSQRPVNFDQDGIDVALRVGVMPRSLSDEPQAKGDLDMVASWNGVEALCLWQEEIAPICSKTYLDVVGGIEKVSDLDRVTLIHNDSRPGMWNTWLNAQGCSGLAGAKNLGFGQRYMAILAAKEGRGVACVPTLDIEMLSWREELIYPLSGKVKTGNAYYLLRRRDSVREREAKLLCDWMQNILS